jgi:hypothetical protein
MPEADKQTLRTVAAGALYGNIADYPSDATGHDLAPRSRSDVDSDA